MIRLLPSPHLSGQGALCNCSTKISRAPIPIIESHYTGKLALEKVSPHYTTFPTTGPGMRNYFGLQPQIRSLYCRVLKELPKPRDYLSRTRLKQPPTR